MLENLDKIQEIMQEIIFLLEFNYETEWCSVIKKLLEDFDANAKEKSVDNIMKIYAGGMGFFPDLVLLRNHEIPIGISFRDSVSPAEYETLKNENKKLKSLRTELFQACFDYRQSIGKH